MQLPARIDTLPAALEVLRTSLAAEGPAPLVRVFLADGTVVSGELNSVAEDHLTVMERGGHRRELSIEAVDAIQQAVPDRNREGVLMLAGIVFGTAGVVGISVYGAGLGATATGAFQAVAVVGTVTFHALMKTRLREWLVRWVPWFRRT